MDAKAIDALVGSVVAGVMILVSVLCVFGDPIRDFIREYWRHQERMKDKGDE